MPEKGFRGMKEIWAYVACRRVKRIVLASLNVGVSRRLVGYQLRQ